MNTNEMMELIIKAELKAWKQDKAEKVEVMRIIREAKITGEIDPVILQDALLCIEKK